MSKVSYAKLNLKVNNEVNTFKFMDNEIEVLKYLPIEDKYDLVSIALQSSEEDGFYNDIKLDMYFHLYLVYMYSNLSFTEKQKENEAKIYDSLKSSGFLDAFLAAIDENEYNELLNALDLMKEDKLKYNNTTGNMIIRAINELPTKVDAATKLLKEVDLEKFQNVIQLANASGYQVNG